jgi:hypothetical protein
MKLQQSITGVAALAISIFAANLTRASLIGESISASGNGISPTTAVIGAGIEFPKSGVLVSFDFGADTLTVTPTISGSSNFGGWGAYTFSGFNSTISGLTLLSNNGFTGSVITNDTFTDHSLTLDFGSGSFANNSKLVFGIETPKNSVPDNAGTFALLSATLTGLVAMRRRLR